MNRQFFNSNKIQNLNPITPQKSLTSTAQHFHTTQKLRRVTSCRDTTMRLNPQKFINREVFNSKLYSAKPFNIAVEFNKESQDKIDKMYSFENNQNVSIIQKQLRQQAAHQFSVGINNLSHYFKTVYQQIDSEGIDGPFKKQITLLKEGFDKLLRLICKQIQHYQDSYLNLMFAQKSGQKLQSPSRILQFQPFSSIPEKKSIRSSRKLLIQSSITRSRHQKKCIKPQTSQSLRSSKVFDQKGSNSSQVKTLTNKLNLIEFESKKQILRIESLQNEKRENEQRIIELQEKIELMSDKMGKVNEMEDFYNYKIKKLKEELEVAHIVKEQNLAQKMKYILNQ